MLCCADRKRRARAPAVKASPLTPTAAVKDEASKREFMVGGGCTGTGGELEFVDPGVDWFWGIWTAASCLLTVCVAVSWSASVTKDVGCTTHLLLLQEKQKEAAAQQQGDASKGADGSQAGQPADGWGDSMPLFKDLALDGKQRRRQAWRGLLCACTCWCGWHAARTELQLEGWPRGLVGLSAASQATTHATTRVSTWAACAGPQSLRSPTLCALRPGCACPVRVTRLWLVHQERPQC